MSFDEKTAIRIRRALAGRADVVEKKIFGSLCFMLNGQMCCGLTKTDFMVRVGRDSYDEALQQPRARPMDFTGRPLAGMIYVDPPGYRTDAALAKWVQRGVDFVSSNAAKKKARPRTRAARTLRAPDVRRRV